MHGLQEIKRLNGEAQNAVYAAVKNSDLSQRIRANRDRKAEKAVKSGASKRRS